MRIREHTGIFQSDSTNRTPRGASGSSHITFPTADELIPEIIDYLVCLEAEHPLEHCRTAMTRKRIGQDGAVIRHTTEADIPSVLRLYALARQTMRESGNPLQWPEKRAYPGLGELREDMRRNVSYVIEVSGSIVGSFALIPGKEPTYAKIYGGRWLDAGAGAAANNAERPYCTIHRLAGDPAFSGIADCCFGWSKRQCGSLRADTHRDNIIMQHAFSAAGFVHCGTIFLTDGSERLAYQWMDDHEN